MYECMHARTHTCTHTHRCLPVAVLVPVKQKGKNILVSSSPDFFFQSRVACMHFSLMLFVCLRACMCIYVRIYVHTRVCVRIYIYIYTHTHTLNIRIHVFICVYMHVNMYLYMYICMLHDDRRAKKNNQV